MPQVPVPSSQDVNAPFNTTAYAQLTGAQLYQLVSGLAPYVDKGMIVMTEDANGLPQVPNANTTIKWQNYIWKRIGSDGNIYLYVWNPARSQDVTWLKWQSINLIGIQNSVITNAMLAGGITYDKLSTVNWNSLINIPQATGSIAGTYPTLSIAAQSIAGGGVQGQIMAKSITADELADSIIDPTGDKFVPGQALRLLRTNAGGNAAEWVDPSVIGQVSFSYQNPANIALAQYSVSAHNLGAVPSIVRAVLVCIDAGGDLGFVQDDELDIHSFWDDNKYQIAAFGANIANVFCQLSRFNVVYTNQKQAVVGAEGAIDPTRWAVKIYARV
jgi:hypothetical protein